MNRGKQGKERETYVIVSEEVVGDEPLQLLSHPASGVHDVAVSLSQVPDLLQCQATLVVSALSRATFTSLLLGENLSTIA